VDVKCLPCSTITLDTPPDEIDWEIYRGPRSRECYCDEPILVLGRFSILDSSDAPKKCDVLIGDLFVLARVRKGEEFTSLQRTSSPGRA